MKAGNQKMKAERDSRKEQVTLPVPPAFFVEGFEFIAGTRGEQILITRVVAANRLLHCRDPFDPPFEGGDSVDPPNGFHAVTKFKSFFAR